MPKLFLVPTETCILNGYGYNHFFPSLYKYAVASCVFDTSHNDNKSTLYTNDNVITFQLSYNDFNLKIRTDGDRMATSPRAVMLNLFVPYRMVNLATNISNACSKIYKNDFDLTIPEWRILARLAEHDKLNAKDVGEVTFMDKSKVSRAVKILEEKDYILRTKDTNDNRANYLSLKEEGREMYKKIAPKALDWEKQLISVLDASEYRDLMRILEKLDKQVVIMESEEANKA